MIPIVKGWGTEVAQEVTYLGVQVHGGMGFIEETGAAQHYRDARITTIYEGTTGIQANDLIGRKTARDGGVVARSVIGEIAGLASALSADANGALVPIGHELQSATAALKSAVDWVVPAYGKASRAAHAASVPYLRLWGLVGGWQLARGPVAAPACGRQRRRDFLSRQDRHRAVLRRMPAAAGSRAGARHHTRQRVGTGAVRRAVLTPASG
jgi:acyl-CoA dehydrogenase